MDKNDKKMEEFFRRSMEQFDDGPSGSVWDKLSDNLEAEETFLTRSVRWIRKVLPYAILLLAFGAISVYTFQSFNDLKNTNQLLSSTNLELNETISTLNIENSQLVKTNNDLSQALKSHTEETQEIRNEIQKSKNALASSIRQNLVIKQKYKLVTALNVGFNSQLETCVNDMESLSIAYQVLRRQMLGSDPIELAGSQMPGSQMPGSQMPGSQMPGSQTTGSQMPESQNKDLGLLGATKSAINEFGSLLTSRFDGIGKSLSDIKIPLKWEPLDFSIFENKNEPKKKSLDLSEESKKSQYRFGVTGRVYNATVENGFNVNLSNSYGFIHEFRFGDHWSLTNSFEYNDQEYTIDSDTGALPESVLSRFPDSPGDYANVRSIKSRSKYFDTQLGIKYQRPNKRGNINYFFNPSVVWQLYLPQEFNYDLIQAQDLLVQRGSYVGYLGSVNLQIGLERKLTKNLDFQLALFAERSLIELGHDNQIVNLVGLRSSVLFGK